MQLIVIHGVEWSVFLSFFSVVRSLSVTIVSPVKTAEPIDMPFGMWTRVPGNHILDGVKNPFYEGAILRGKWSGPLESMGTVCHKLCKSGWTNRDAIWDVDLGRPKEACITWGCTLAPRGEYDGTVHVLWPLVEFLCRHQCIWLPRHWNSVLDTCRSLAL